jgi:SAM-dependent methyltransferase
MYEKIILDHYASVAKEEGHLDSCTMADNRIREIETKFILDAIKNYIKENFSRDLKNIKLLDAGCGNGFTLAQIQKELPGIQISGIEYTPELRMIANKKKLACEVAYGDIKDRLSIPSPNDIIITQRVIINLLNVDDQKLALENLLYALRPGGYLICVEAFESGLINLNRCRAELSLSEIPPAHHNLYLKDDFFKSNRGIIEVPSEFGENILSTHYFISRVLHDLALNTSKSEFTRNSLFVSFFDKALPLGIGEFSPLKCNIFKKLN